MALRRTLGLGTLVIRGSAFDFRPATRLEFDAAPGDEVHVGLTYNYEDTSPLKNVGRVTLTIELAGVKRVAEIKIRDLPGIDDRDRRFLGQVVTLASPGEHAGRFEVAADLEESTWKGSGRAQASFKEEGKFVVKVQ